MANSIDFPTETKWFITYNDEEVIISWGDVTPDETMTTGQPVLTTFDNDEYVWQSLEAGALSYLLKSTSSIEVLTAVRALYRGHSQLDSSIAKKVFSNLKPLEKQIDYHALLSKRELEVLQLLGTGKSNKEIAKSLHLSEGTIRNHLSNIFCKLDLRDRTQAALWAQQYIG